VYLILDFDGVHNGLTLKFCFHCYLGSKNGQKTTDGLHPCCRDKDGYHWLTGRVDDVINVRYVLGLKPFLFSLFFPAHIPAKFK